MTVSTTYARALTFTLGEEGGYTVDDGGPTMYGVTQARYDEWRDTQQLSRQSVRLIQMPDEVQHFYTQYWNAGGEMVDALGRPLTAMTMFDMDVNDGTGWGVRCLQRALGVSIDGVWGPATRSALPKYSDQQLAVRVTSMRLRRYVEIVEAKASDLQYLPSWAMRSAQFLDEQAVK